MWSVGGETRPVFVDECSRLIKGAGAAGVSRVGAAAAAAAIAGRGAGSLRSVWIAAATEGAVRKNSETLIVSKTILTFG